jgi:hypothetical protein
MAGADRAAIPNPVDVIVVPVGGIRHDRLWNMVPLAPERQQ